MIEPQELARDPEEFFTADNSARHRYDDLTPDELAKKLMSYARAACSYAENADITKRMSAMARSYRSVNNEHSEGSKYKHKNYSSRSKLFIPKTRGAVKAKMVAAHSALFSTDDVVAVSAEDDTDVAQQASAELNKELLNYRLDRTSHRAGIPWYRIAMGSAYSTTVAGICCTKQYWQFKERLEEADEDFDPADPNLDQTVVGMSGRPMRRKVLRDRPMIEPHAPENVIVDMAAPWWDVVQEGAFFIVKMAMNVGDVKSMMKPGGQHMGGGAWYDIPEKVMSAAVSDQSGMSVRTARGQGADRYSRSSRPAVNDFDTIWVHENFIRCNDRDYHFWSLGTKQLLSEPGEVGTIGHYPAHHGERPYVMGVGSIEPDNALPMSHVEAWRPLNDEINDVRNLRLDTMKQSIAPIAIYRRGANVDLRAVRERGPDATIQVSNLEKDLKFERASGPDASSFAEVDRLNGEFDELAGSFATSTVQSSRAIGETARGMQLVNNSANSVQEFDLQVFLQTWAEPTLRQVVWLEQYYETDETLMALMAKKAKLYQRFGTDAALDELLVRQVTVKVNIGSGAGDPVQKLQRINAALDMSIKASPFVQGQVKPKAEEMFNQFWSGSGISAGRLFDFVDAETAEKKAPPDPNMLKLELEKEKMQIERELKMEESEVKKQELKLRAVEIALELETLDRQSAQADQEFGLRQEEAQFGRGLKTREVGFKEESGRTDQKMKAAAQNRQLIDEDNAEATGGGEMQAGPSPLEQAVTVMAQMAAQMGQAMQVMAAGQQQQSEMLAENQAQQSEMIAALIGQMNAPKRVVRDTAGTVVGVETVQ